MYDFWINLGYSGQKIEVKAIGDTNYFDKEDNVEKINEYVNKQTFPIDVNLTPAQRRLLLNRRVAVVFIPAMQ